MPTLRRRRESSEPAAGNGAAGDGASGNGVAGDGASGGDAAGDGTTDGPAQSGQMTLIEHLRELRVRLVKCVLAIAVGSVVGWFLFPPVFDIIKEPFLALRADQNLDTKLTLSGVTDAFFLQLKLSLLIGVVFASPIWLYQVWAFIVPGLHRNERRLTLAFLGSAVPLFLAGVGLAYLVLPKGLNLLLSFTPEGVSNFVQVNIYLSFIIRLTLAFGIAFELPVFIVMLNAAGVVSAATLRRRRSVIVFAVFVFAAVATPTGDPVTMLSLGLPMWALFEIATLIAWFTDRRRARNSSEPDYSGLSDDEASPLDPNPGPADETADH